MLVSSGGYRANPNPNTQNDTASAGLHQGVARNDFLKLNTTIRQLTSHWHLTVASSHPVDYSALLQDLAPPSQSKEKWSNAGESATGPRPDQKRPSTLTSAYISATAKTTTRNRTWPVWTSLLPSDIPPSQYQQSHRCKHHQTTRRTSRLRGRMLARQATVTTILRPQHRNLLANQTNPATLARKRMRTRVRTKRRTRSPRLDHWRTSGKGLAMTRKEI